MDRSPLAKLPREIRDCIYGIVLKQRAEIGLTIDRTHIAIPSIKAKQARYQSHHPALAPHALALILTCKQLRHETAGVFFKVNKFEFDTKLVRAADGVDNEANMHVTSDLCIFREWFKIIGPTNTTSLRHVNISLGSIHDKQFRRKQWFRTWVAREVYNTMEASNRTPVGWHISMDFAEDRALTPENVMETLMGRMTMGRVELWEVPLVEPDVLIRRCLAWVKLHIRQSPSDEEDQEDLLEELEAVRRMFKIFIGVIERAAKKL